MEDISIGKTSVEGKHQYRKSGKMRDWCDKAMKEFCTDRRVYCQSSGWQKIRGSCKLLPGRKFIKERNGYSRDISIGRKSI